MLYNKKNALPLAQEALTSIASVSILSTLWCHFFQSAFLMDKTWPICFALTGSFFYEKSKVPSGVTSNF